jgi:hypothetical protein
MDQSYKKPVDTQVLYLGRWVNRDHFACFVYKSTGERLVKSYDEFSDAIASGTWFATKDDLKKSVEPVRTEEPNVVDLNRKPGNKSKGR